MALRQLVKQIVAHLLAVALEQLRLLPHRVSLQNYLLEHLCDSEFGCDFLEAVAAEVEVCEPRRAHGLRYLLLGARCEGCVCDLVVVYFEVY